MATDSGDATRRPFQVAVFGATGFTGQYVVEELARAAAEVDFQGSPLRWAVAGRNRQRLQETLSRAAEKLGQPQLTLDVGIIICDVGDPASLAEMCKQTALVLDCVGPYRFYGEPVIKACVENGASCIDISGEPQFLEEMEFKYDSKAADKGVYIIGSSGFDSIPADLGVLYTRNNFKGTLTAVESFLKFKSGPEGTCIHDGTWQSAIHGIADQGRLRQLRKKAGKKPLPVVGEKLKRRGAVFYSNEVKEYSIPFMGSDAAVVRRTQRYLHECLKESPVQYAAYFAVGGVAEVIKLMFAGLFFILFTKFGFGRNLMIKYPAFFSFGYFTKEGPSEKQMADSSFEMTFFGKGYSEGQTPDQGKPNLKICTQVRGPEPAYIATPIAMVQAAVTLLKETSSLPKRCNSTARHRRASMVLYWKALRIYCVRIVTEEVEELRKGIKLVHIYTAALRKSSAGARGRLHPVDIVHQSLTPEEGASKNLQLSDWNQCDHVVHDENFENTLLATRPNVTRRGGVYTPGAAFSKTSLIERLNKNGIQFTVIRNPEA